jgi:hypothetical protein
VYYETAVFGRLTAWFSLGARKTKPSKKHAVLQERNQFKGCEPRNKLDLCLLERLAVQ